MSKLIELIKNVSDSKLDDPTASAMIASAFEQHVHGNHLLAVSECFDMQKKDIKLKKRAIEILEKMLAQKPEHFIEDIATLLAMYNIDKSHKTTVTSVGTMDRNDLYTSAINKFFVNNNALAARTLISEKHPLLATEKTMQANYSPELYLLQALFDHNVDSSDESRKATADGFYRKALILYSLRLEKMLKGNTKHILTSDQLFLLQRILALASDSPNEATKKEFTDRHQALLVLHNKAVELQKIIDAVAKHSNSTIAKLQTLSAVETLEKDVKTIIDSATALRDAHPDSKESAYEKKKNQGIIDAHMQIAKSISIRKTELGNSSARLELSASILAEAKKMEQLDDPKDIQTMISSLVSFSEQAEKINYYLGIDQCMAQLNALKHYVSYAVPNDLNKFLDSSIAGVAKKQKATPTIDEKMYGGGAGPAASTPPASPRLFSAAYTFASTTDGSVTTTTCTPVP